MSEWGTFAVDRGIFGHHVFADEPFTEREAWLWLIGEAAYRPHRKRVGAAVVDLVRGQLAHATRFMAQKWKWSDGSVRRFLAKLSSESMIQVRNDAGVTQITICNYEAYQPAPEKPDAGMTQERRKEEKGNKDSRDDADAVRARAHELCEQVYDIFGFDREFIPPGWMGLEHFIEAGIRGGWKPDLIRVAARKIAAKKRDGPPRGYRYLEPAIVQEHVLAAAPPPQPRDNGHASTIGERQLNLVQTIPGGRAAPATGWQQSRDAWRAAHAELKERLYGGNAEADGSCDSGGQIVQLASAAGRE
jgi:hypothetical protein